MKETTLRQAFELQQFAPDQRLQAVIDEAHARVAARQLSDEELELVAGGVTPEQVKRPEEQSK